MKKNFLINRDFGLLFFGRLVSDIGHHLYNFAIGWYILTLTSSAAQAGFYMAFGTIVFVVLTPFAGVLVDRWNRIKIIYMTDFIRGISIFLAGLVILTTPVVTLGSWVITFNDALPQLVVLYITAFFFSVNGALFSPAVTASIPYLVKDEDLMRANSLNSGMGAFVSILGGLLAGVLYTTLGIGLIFMITSVSYVLSAISEMFIQTKSHEKNDTKLTIASAVKEFSEGFTFILQKQGMLMFVVVVLIINMLAAPLFGVAQPYFFNQVVQSEPWVYSLIGFAFSIGSIVMALILAGKPTKELVNKPLRRGLLGFTLGVAFNGVIVYLFTEAMIGVWVMFALMLTVSVGIGLMITYVNTPIGVALQRYVPKDKLGRVNAIINLMATGVIPFSTVLAGLAIESLSLPLFYMLVAIGMGLAATLAYRSKSLRHF
jgi:MFS transporter, DHA3 family, macrolide efflux protein